MNKIFIVSFIVTLFLVATVFGLYFYHQKTTTPSNSSATQTQNSTTTPSTNSAIQPTPALVYPMDRFLERITVNDFGAYYPGGGNSNPDTKVCTGAVYYSGYHTADDLETFSEEAKSPVPVYAIADGEIRRIGPVKGYGGLIVIKSTINNSLFTIYYGHLDLSASSLKVGDQVFARQKIAELGMQCSEKNGNVRRHLHFAIHKGNTIDDRGYVTNQTELNDWIDPKTLY